jgi:hypothetical protein
MTQTWLLAESPRVAMKDRYFPSGLHLGLEAENPLAVIGRGSPPAAGAIQIWVPPGVSGDEGVLMV